MPLFRRAQWPRDHRDEVVAGALVGAVVIVLGYASGIGAPSGADAAAAPPTPPPAATAPPSPTQIPDDSGAQAPGDTAVPPAGGAGLPVGTGEMPVPGGTGGHAGHGGTTATPTSPSPAPSGSATASPPADGETCEDGEVHLVQPLLTGLTQPLLGALDGTGGTADPGDADPTAAPQASPCVGLAPVDAGGLLGITAIPSPTPEVTP
ncbi:hypothetical protein [Streptomyces sp. S.PNR 29]|uniref:hypothetical protein n=1 Tax=Streptomyces sp. S.PNR 29 TaxID=2973805 RepID=UPI0025AFB902|nr:hypothetical protein [Streptomyces sp. S.PNR 29]MDN0200931.1 hypothetical protein [Streptomyces sp. S.PNR 29]